MGRLVKVDTGFQTVSAVQDLLEVKLAAAQAGFVHRVKIIQKTKLTSEDLEVNIKRGIGFTSGSGGGSATVIKGQSGDATTTFTAAERNNTTQAVAGGGSIEVLESGVFNLAGAEWEYCPTPELRPPIGPSEAVIISIDTAPAAGYSMRAILEIELTHG